MSKEETEYHCPVCRSYAEKQKQLRRIQTTMEIKVRAAAVLAVIHSRFCCLVVLLALRLADLTTSMTS